MSPSLSCPVSSPCNAGGSPKYPQIKAIQSGVQVVIATPGRLNDIMEMGKINMTNVMTLALDEADRMLDMGFEPQIRTIIDAMPTKRQTLFFTATWPKEVQRLARDFVQNPVHITVGDAGKLNANKSITQHIQVSCQDDDVFMRCRVGSERRELLACRVYMMRPGPIYGSSSVAWVVLSC